MTTLLVREKNLAIKAKYLKFYHMLHKVFLYKEAKPNIRIITYEKAKNLDRLKGPQLNFKARLLTEGVNMSSKGQHYVVLHFITFFFHYPQGKNQLLMLSLQKNLVWVYPVGTSK